MRKIIFLGVDGVLVPGRRDDLQRRRLRPRSISRECVANVNVLASALQASIVVVGKRFRDDDHARRSLASWGITAKVAGILPGIPMAAGVKWVSVTRGRKIRAWLDLYGIDVVDYVILDSDADDITDDLLDRFVGVDATTGITVDNIKAAATILVGGKTKPKGGVNVRRPACWVR